ncbi:carboxypeptidase-like regulatory domain-containing protein [Fulvivirgaceae bacterium PWU5]|uniref:Carboxypeptidase-like regulatory domain-containing protein n=1 Tax=Dawidia cretensis TaxID=2782350 RepID=A0AAP2GSW7_9BACT|nr:carboxypeptidase-like regulatory domain-containing protein [Dawidia cretensis]
MDVCVRAVVYGIWVFIGLWVGAWQASGQTIVRGVVTDADTKEPLPFVNIVFKGTTIGSTTDIDGRYTVTTNTTNEELHFSFLGYKTVIRKVKVGETQDLNVRLTADAQVLEEVTVTTQGRERYRNKNNPAVDLVREMIEHKEQNRMTHYDNVEYEQYEKLQMSLSNLSDKFKERKLFRKYKWMFENVDTTTIKGKALLPIYLQENLTDKYYQRSPEHNKSVVKAHQKVSFDDYVDNAGMSTYLNYLYNDIDIYENNITLLTNQFLSPIANSAPTFYKFYITDTLKDVTPKLVELSFAPRDAGGFLFQGRLYVTLDSNYAVQRVDMTVNKNINLNWVRELFINQEFEQMEDGKFQVVKSRMRADFGITQGRGGLYGERVVSYKNFVINQPRPPDFFEGEKQQQEKEAEGHTDEYWLANRHDSLSHAESKVYQNIDSLQKVPSFRRTMDIATLLLAGYKSFGWWELGPVNTFYSFNPVEGFRLRVGGRTTPKFNERLYFETYGAYGFKDEKWKYFLSATYSFTGKSIWQFPVRTLRVSYQHDMKIPGQELQFIQEDNFLLSFKRGVNDKWLYNDIWVLDYLHEFDNHISYRVGFKNWRQTPAGGLRYERNTDDELQPVPNVITSEINLEFRWAPGEQFYQGKLYRIPIPNRYPILTARFIGGIKNLFNSQYNYQNVALNVYKRVYLSQFGYTDMVLEGGYIFGKVPFPLLAIHRANQTYSYQLQSYNLMNFLEFVSDKYVSLSFDHYFNGFIFNKIPLLKKLKWREVATFKVLYGSIRRENDPRHNAEAFAFPVNDQGVETTYSLQPEPYMEASVGIANIFKLIRVDVVKRLSYLDHPEVSQWGLRARFKFDF